MTIVPLLGKLVDRWGGGASTSPAAADHRPREPLMTKSTTVAAIAARVENATEGLDGVWILETGEAFEGGRIVGVYTDRDRAGDDFLDRLATVIQHAHLILLARDCDLKNGAIPRRLARWPVCHQLLCELCHRRMGFPERFAIPAPFRHPACEIR